MNELPIACTLDEDALQTRRHYLVDLIETQSLERKERERGYAFRFEASDAVLDELVEIIKVERVCCRFLQFTLKTLPGNGPVWLEIEGPEGTKEFLQAMLA